MREPRLIHIPIRPNVTVAVQMPWDLTTAEARKVKAVLIALGALHLSGVTMPNPKDTLSLVERLTAARKGARTEEDARTIADAQDEIERLTSQGGVPEGQFLLERLSEVEFSGCDEEFVRDWLGHVEPAIERFRSALAAAPSPPVQQSRAVNVPGGQWHDISTAPKDGSKILAWDGDYVIVRADPNGGWSDDFQQYLRLDKWMPLPAPPMLEAPINAVPKPEGE